MGSLNYDWRVAFKKEHSVLCLYRAKVALIVGISVVPFFAGLDYILAHERFLEFLTLRLSTTAVAVIFLVLIFLFQSFGLRFSSLLVSVYGFLLGVMISFMCLRLGGFNSTYYVGNIIVILGASLVMPWNPGYHLFTTLGIYVSYIFQIFLVGMNAPIGTFINNNYFLFSAVGMTYVGSILQYRMHFQKFLADQQIREAHEKLKELDKAKSSFFANVSHELKTPMTLVVTPLEYAMEKVTPGAANVTIPLKLFETVRQNAYRLSSGISDLVDLARNDVGKAVIEAAEIQDPGEYFGKMFDSVLSLMEKKGISHEYSCEGAGGTKTLKPHCFDKAKMDKVIINLLTNAVKFTPGGGKISLRVWDIPPHPPLKLRGGEEGEILKIEVSDTGIGIPAEKLPLVFERFMQVDSSSTRSYGGMGIGLSLVKEFVDQHGGRVWVESTEGKGTKFCVELPRGRHHFRVPVAEVKKGDVGSGVDLPEGHLILALGSSLDSKSGPKVEKGGLRGTILIVDDNSDMRLSVRQVLEEHYHVLEAADGEEGVRVAMEKRPDLVISDIMMPHKDGYGLVKDLRACPETNKIPIIFLTAKSGEEILARGIRDSADDYISKPFHPKDLLARVENLIHHS